MLFWWICGGESVLPVLLLRHLGSSSSFTFIKRLFSSFSLSATRVVSSAYLRLWIFLPDILIPACASSTLVFCMMYSACKLNKQGDNIQPWRTPFPIWNQSVVPCPVLAVILNLHTDLSVVDITVFRVAILLLNQTRVLLLASRKANLLTSGSGKGKCRLYLQGQTKSIGS